MRTDALVIGGGVIGLSVAYRLAESGLQTTIVDSSGSRGSSWVAAGMLAPVSEAMFGEAALTRLNLAALPKLCEGAMLSDVIAINASIDIVMGEIDR